MFRILSGLALGAMLCGPVTVIARADDEHHEHEKAKRYYDKERNDYHEWNEHENRAYRRWLEERREKYRDYTRLERERQEEYWRWRHQHPDTMLWPHER
jgi:hypothetical protein